MVKINDPNSINLKVSIKKICITLVGILIISMWWLGIDAVLFQNDWEINLLIAHNAKNETDIPTHNSKLSESRISHYVPP
jgi:uncharacterized membrane protein (Fun14 family)